MVAENLNEQSTTGKLTSGYMKATGYTNMVGVIFAYIFGGLMILVGILLALLFRNFIVLLIFAGLGLLVIFLAKLGAKHSKKMREGKYYQVGKGWVKPE